MRGLRNPFMFLIASLAAASMLHGGSIVIPSTGPQNRWAVLIGVDDGPNQVTATQARIATTLRAEFGYPAANVQHLYNAEATPDAIRAKFIETIERVGPGDSLFLFVALPQKLRADDAVALPSGADPEKPWTQITTGDFANWLSQLRARSAFVVLPVCGASSKSSAYALEELRYSRSTEGSLQVAAICEEEPGTMSAAADTVEQALMRADGPISTLELLRALTERLSRRAYVVSSGSPAAAATFVRERNKLTPLITILNSAGTPLSRVNSVRQIVEIISAEPLEYRSNLIAQAIPPLVRAIEDADRSVRLAAVWAVGELRSEPTAAALSSRFRSATDVEERAAIVAAASRIGGPHAITTVNAALSDPTPTVRVAGVRAALLISEPTLASTVVNLGSSDTSDDVRLAILQAAPQIGVEREKILALVRVGLASPVAAVRRQAIASWGELGESPAVDDLMTLVRSDADANVRQTAAYAFGRGSIPDDQRTETVNLLMRALRSDVQPRVREAAAWSLGRLGGGVVETTLIQSLRRTTETQSVRVSAAEALGNLKSSRAVDTLIHVLRSEGPELRRASARALGMIGETRALQALFTAASDEDSYVRSEAAAALERLNPESGLTAVLLRNLENKSPATRIEAVEKLVAVPTDQVSIALTNHLGDPSPEVRSAVIKALKKFEDPATRQRIINALSASDVLTRQSAVALAGELRMNDQRLAILAIASDETASGPLRADAVRALSLLDTGQDPFLRAARDKDALVREAAAEVLGKKPSDRAIEELKRLSRDDAVNVREKAIVALRALPSERRRD
jgi:HEAT repeat protein